MLRRIDFGSEEAGRVEKETKEVMNVVAVVAVEAEEMRRKRRQPIVAVAVVEPKSGMTEEAVRRKRRKEKEVPQME